MAGMFLKLNGYQLENDHDDEVSFTLKVANEDLTIEQITEWLEKHSKTIL
jgi:prophage maintenance system killer protein